MSSEITFLIAVATFLGGALLGLAALRKSGSEASKASADATAVIVGASGDVVKQLREQLAEVCRRLDAEEARGDRYEARIVHLEVTVNTWEDWAERVLSLLDRSLSMLGADQAAKLETEVKRVKRMKPVRINPDEGEPQ